MPCSSRMELNFPAGHMTDSAASMPLPDVLRFMQALWSLSHALDRTSKQMAGTLGVTGPQRLVLRVVGLHPGLSAGDLAGILHVHPSTLTGILQRLAAQKLLIRSAHAADRRRAVLQLTRRGMRVNARSSGTVEAAIGRAIGDLSERDRVACHRVLAHIVDQLDVAASGRSADRRRDNHVPHRRRS